MRKEDPRMDAVVVVVDGEDPVLPELNRSAVEWRHKSLSRTSLLGRGDDRTGP